VNEASLLAARDGKSKVYMEDFESAKDKVMMGVERTSMIISDEEKELTAYHESGHALVAKLMPKADPVYKVSIIPRGRSLGVTAQLPMNEKHNYSESYIKTRLNVLLGGRAAEKLVFNELTTGGGNDIEVATEMARKMVCEWGMSDLVGPLTFGKKDEEIFLGREIATKRDYSESTAMKIDEEVNRIIREAEKEAMKLLKDNENKLHRVAKELLKYETIDGNDLDKIMAGKRLRRRRSKSANGAKDGKAKESASKTSEEKKVAEKSA
jgi:cell division protease FtsH